MRLVLTSLDLEQLGRSGVAAKLIAWVKSTGAKNVSSGVIRCDAFYKNDTMIYSCHFDSSHWTGRGFKGFGVKNLGVAQTL